MSNNKFDYIFMYKFFIKIYYKTINQIIVVPFIGQSLNCFESVS